MSNSIDLFSGGNPSVPAHLRNVQGGLTDSIADTIGGEAVPTIGLKGSRFRLKEGGQELAVRDEHFLDVVIVAAAPAISRIYYAQSFGSDEQQKPACFSADGVKPSPESEMPQCASCALCPQNEKGSRISDNGQAAKACSYYRRLGVSLLGDTSGKVYRLDVKSMGLFGEGNGLAKSFNEYVKFLRSRNAELTTLVTRLTFDTEASVPKLLFQAARWLTAEEYEVSKNHDREAADNAVRIEYKGTSVSLQAEAVLDIPGERPAALEAPKPTPPKPAPARTKPVAVPAPAPAPVQAAPAPVAPPKPAPVADSMDDLDSLLDALDSF
jgi:hypothetical protein